MFYAPSWFSAEFPKDKVLDGEIWMKPGAFRETSRIVKKQQQTEEQASRWKQLSFCVFDVVDDEMLEYKDRYAWLQKHLKGCAYVRLVPQTLLRNQVHLDELLQIALSAGQEGIMVRNPHAPYEHKRSHNLVKVKVFFDCEARVTGSEKGKGRNEHVMGKLLCELPNGVTFRCGTGFTDAERKKPPKIGSIITVKYQELDAKSGRPRFPTYLRDRSVELSWEDVVAQYRKDHPHDTIGTISASSGDNNNNDDGDGDDSDNDGDKDALEDVESGDADHKKTVAVKKSRPKAQVTTSSSPAQSSNSSSSTSSISSSSSIKSTQTFVGETICVSGSFSVSQGDLRALIAKHGGIVADAPTKKCTFLVADCLGSTKTVKAQKNGTPIVTEAWVHASIASGSKCWDVLHFLSGASEDLTLSSEDKAPKRTKASVASIGKR